MSTMVSANILADLLGVSKFTVNRWEENKKYIPSINSKGKKLFKLSDFTSFPVVEEMINTKWFEEEKTKPIKEYKSIELFAGAGGLALGLEKAGFKAELLNEIDPHACSTLKKNRPNWNIMEGDIAEIDFSIYKDKIDFLSGGFPCQSFSYAGKKMGFEDTRGTLFFELARAIKEIQPKVFMAENVKGLLSHEKGQTLETIKTVIDELGYDLVEPRVLKALHYKVPQKRERLILIGIRKDISKLAKFKWPSPHPKVFALKDAFFKGELYDSDVPLTSGQEYTKRKKEIMSLVPMGGYWKDLPIDIQKEYMKKSFYLGGGKTGMARRLSLYEPSLTLTCAPAQNQTERCHPTETRPLTVQEYARIQTFPDAWKFQGSITKQYKQIGNAVPVNLAAAIGRSLIRFLNDVEINS